MLEDIAVLTGGKLFHPVGVSNVKRALEEPIRQIVINAGVEGSVIVPLTRCRMRPRSPA
jgi:chaperonin GroEL (HSP60 family)